MAEALRGSLEHVALPSLLQLVEAEACCGVLQIDGSARISLSNGRVVAAAFGPFDGRTALFETFLLSAGTFVIHAGLDDPGGAPLGDTLEIVMTGCRLADEWGRIAPLFLGEARPVEDERVRSLVPHLKHRNVQGAVAAANLPRLATVDPVLHALERGQLREVEPPPAAAFAPSGDFHDLLDVARRRLRARDWDAAEDILRHALELRPGDRVAAQNLARVRVLRSQSEPVPPSQE